MLLRWQNMRLARCLWTAVCTPVSFALYVGYVSLLFSLELSAGLDAPLNFKNISLLASRTHVLRCSCCSPAVCLQQCSTCFSRRFFPYSEMNHVHASVTFVWPQHKSKLLIVACVRCALANWIRNITLYSIEDSKPKRSRCGYFIRSLSEPMDRSVCAHVRCAQPVTISDHVLWSGISIIDFCFDIWAFSHCDCVSVTAWQV